jgi:hypothetical protein
VDNSVYIFGGSSGFDPEYSCVTRFSNDLFKLDLAEKPTIPTTTINATEDSNATIAG